MRGDRPESRRWMGLPGWALAIGYLAAVAAPLALAAASGAAPADIWTEAAAAGGMAGGVMMLLQLVSSGRFRQLSGRIGIDVTMGFHKWAAPVALLLILAHPILLAGPVDSAAPGRLWAMLSAPRLWEGVTALALLIVMVASAILRDRLPVRYEIWRASHAAVAVLLVGLTVYHVLRHGFYASEGPLRLFWPVLGVAVLLPMLTIYLRKWRDYVRHEWRVTECRAVADRLWALTIESGTGRPLRFRAGQFAWLAAMGRRLPIFADHPFSIASGPQEGTRLRFVIQEAGDFTGRVGEIEPGRVVGLDAPHGSFVLDDDAADGIVLIAGGVGIAPILGILEDLAARGEKRPVRLILAARDPGAMLEPPLIEPPLAHLDSRALRLVDEGADPDAGLRQGPVRPEHLREALDGLEPAKTVAMICGPGAMMSAMTDTLFGLGVPLHRIHFERFAYDDQATSIKDRRRLRDFRVTGAAILLMAAIFALR
ncbi:iron reductase [Rhodobacteraceae bacterium WD3A24]|nr:iron reductase [Rhodobacteraceae bacterium WD3A24]